MNLAAEPLLLDCGCLLRQITIDGKVGLDISPCKIDCDVLDLTLTFLEAVGGVTIRIYR